MTSSEKTAHTHAVDQLLKKLHLVPRDVKPYYTAFVHRSHVNESSVRLEHNERLEFLGDAALELAMTDLLYRHFPDKSEGALTDIRSSCVRGKNLAEIAARLGLAEALLLSRGEERAGGRTNPTLLADVLEALLGAIYLDHGFAAATAFVEKHIYTTLPRILAESLHVDPKSALQEIVQAKWQALPVYVITSESGADHEKTFCIEVSVNGRGVGRGEGNSKKRAQEAAAIHALATRSTWENAA